jgi:peptide/nickel transport system ATP-binding protein
MKSRADTLPPATTGVSEPPVAASVEDLHVTFGRKGRLVHALRGVSFEIGRGEILGVVGESGSGKSVLGLSLLGLLPDPPPRVTGRALVCGVDMTRARKEERRLARKLHLGAVFQDPMTSLNPTMRLGDQVREAAGSVEEALALLEAVGFPEPKRRQRAFPHELSGGQRQRAMIAMALAGHPDLVIADEPTTALDTTVQAQILSLIGDLRDRFSCSFLLITHDLGVAGEVADRIVVLYGGRIAEIGEASRVLRSPAHPYTEGLLLSRLTLDTNKGREIVTLAGEPPDPRNPSVGCPFAPRCALVVSACHDALPEMIAAPSGTLAACIRAEEVAAQTSLSGPGRGATVFAHDPGAAHLTEVAGESERSESPEMPPVVVLKDVTKAFSVRAGMAKRDRLTALHEVSLEVFAGEAVAIVGESGSGKSTLLRIVAGLQSADRGLVRVSGSPQMVFQEAGASLTPWLTVREMLGERLRGDTRKNRGSRISRALDRVGLPADVLLGKPGNLSGGQRQRVALARSTVVPPPILLCDEPTSSLDASLAATVLNLILGLRTELGMAVLFVTHDLAVARIIADRIAVMYLGRIVEIGPAGDVTADPRHPYTRALLAAAPGAETPWSRLQSDPSSPFNPPSGCSFHPRCPEAIEVCSLSPPPSVVIHGGRRIACVHAEEQRDGSG